MVMPVCAAAAREAVIWAAVGAAGVWISQPVVVVVSPSRWTACSVMTVLGA